jgi:hypothetical protein
MSNKAIFASLCICIMTLPGLAHADKGFYLGAAAGVTDIEYSDFELASTTQGYIGYNILPWLGFEAGFTDLGEFEVKDGNSAIEAEAKHLAVTLNDNFGYWNMQVMAKVGFYQAELTPNIPNASASTSEKTGQTYSAHLLKPFGKHFAISAGWQYFNKVSGADMQTYLIGFQAKF